MKEFDSQQSSSRPSMQQKMLTFPEQKVGLLLNTTTSTTTAALIRHQTFELQQNYVHPV